MALEVKKEALVPPKAEAKAKALKAKKVVLKGLHSQGKTADPHITYIPIARDAASPKAAQIFLKANKHQIKPVVKFCDIDVAKVNIINRPDKEKACIQLTPGQNALDIVNKIGII
ncbi:60S ribosomal protein L23a-like [Meles meles]|uniref:60S ribosomal protein L23a-like n=1 Tax=Meles meles TaxID=9662 RepID=UPI001E69C169|nr:60S ribosomal protein L23a-like [Meles meles]